MNNLVDYDGESDEDSPKRRSVVAEAPKDGAGEDQDSVDSRQRRDSDMMFDDEAMYNETHVESPVSDHSDVVGFREPPPPKRREEFHSPSPALRTPSKFPHVSSHASLVSYAGDDEKEDAFEQADRDAENPMGPVTPPSGMVEPRPPERVSQESESDEENERLIDQALEDGRNALKQVEEGSLGSLTPRNDDSPGTREEQEPENKDEDVPIDSEIRIPPAPEQECNPELQARFEEHFQKKSVGFDSNGAIQNRKDFLNPSSYNLFVISFSLDEKGTNFRNSIFNPHMFPSNCYYEKIAEEQRKLTESSGLGKKPAGSTSGGPVAKKNKP